MKNYGDSLQWLNVSIPIIYICLLICSFLFMKWYYIIAFFLYPILMILWFIPKTILSVGKVYLLGSYISAIFTRLSNLKLTIVNFLLIIFSVIFLLFIGSNWTRWFAIIVVTYLYARYIIRFFKGAFKLPTLFGEKTEEAINKMIENELPEKSAIISSYVNQESDTKLEIQELKEKQIRRAILANYAIELLSSRLNGFKGRIAYLISWLWGVFIFFISSVIYFWFLNLQIFKIKPENFIYKGTTPAFDFLYYTFKATATFSDTVFVKPFSILARTIQMSSFFTIGIVFLIIFVSVILSLKQEKMTENLRLATRMFKHENDILVKYAVSNFGIEIKEAIKEIRNIDKSCRDLKKFIDRIF